MNETQVMAGILAAAGYTRAIDSLKGVLINIGTSIGAVMLVFGAIKFAMAIRNTDTGGEYQGLYTIAAGGLLIGLSALVTALS
ncbi:MAG: hypothetical protein K6E75_11990 [Lachnospiraceae bacterium]|nr:hypothetical protein [Lachnospiraceae bacterium]